MANGDGDQSKRPPLNHHDSDSQVSDKGQHGGHHHRQKTAKHHVGGGRIHARVASSKNLHKGPGTTSSAKLSRRQPSPSPDHAFAFPPTAPLSRSGGHRRTTSDVNLSREPSATNLLLKKNSSHTSLKRNRSKVEVVGKKSKSSTNLKGHTTAAYLLHHNNKPSKAHGVNQVHFNLGDDEDDGDNQEDEWVDASTSASPLLSRRTSVVSGGQQSAASSAGNTRLPTASEQAQQPSSPRLQSTRSTNGNDSPHADSTSQHNQYLTSRILERTPAQGAPPMMSAETASVRRTSSLPHTPDSDAAPSPSPRMRPGSSGNKAELTSRFITNESSGSGTGPDSFTGALARAANGRIEVPTPEVRRPKSMGNVAVRGETEEAAVRHPRRDHGGVVTDDDDAAADAKTAAYVMNRTQQKINLQRASSSLEPSIPPHHPALSMAVGMSSPAASQVYGRSETVLPRLLERTGMEYLVVRRYQNPIARSLARLAQIPGQDPKLRIPKQRSAPAHLRQVSELRGGPVQNLRDRDGHRSGDVAGLIGGTGHNRSRPGSRRAAFAALNGDLDGETTGLSGSSLVDGGEDATTVAVLRNLWDKNMDLSASQE